MLDHLPCKRCANLLVTTGASSTGPAHGERRGVCPTPGSGYVVCLPTGETFPAPCKSNSCPVCVRWKAQRIIDALHMVRPEWIVTVDRVGNRWSESQRTMTRYRRLLREAYHAPVEDAYFVEPYRAGGHHAHVLLTGSVPDPDVLAHAAKRAGTTLGSLERITHHGNLGYGLKMAFQARTLPGYLDANNGTLVHASRGFWKVPGDEPVRGGYRALLRAR